MAHKVIILLFLIIAQATPDDMRSICFSKIDDMNYQCISTGCLSFTNATVSNLRHCEMACLANINCRTATFDQSSNNCQLFENIPTEYGSMSSQAGVVTLVTISIRQAPAMCTSMFYNETTYGAGSSLSAVVVVDVNGDEKLDMRVSNFMSNSISVLLNAGNGIFLDQVEYPSNIYPKSIAAADVNNDNKTDIVVVVNYGSNDRVIYFNAGNTTFTNQSSFETGPLPLTVTIADVNNDNKSNIIVINVGSNDIGVYLQCYNYLEN
ncbi:unnamed protein product [Adineta steineri]|uniref:Apple domain-containing protein n=1 Tax=Adineta steineri TaxID=433720 RepID=A0A819ARB6_9BILA|nr:unnamed protein product [Adineta steineri]CAF3786217.1 unnamed protein product [Adineta steineri]